MATSGKKESGPPSAPGNPQPSSSQGDFGYFEFVMDAQGKLGSIEKAIGTLELTVEKQLEEIGKEVYAAKIVIEMAAWLIAALVPLVGAAVALLNHFWK
jgi:hypothetical protein